MQTTSRWVFSAVVGLLAIGCAPSSSSPVTVGHSGVGGDSTLIETLEEAATSARVPAAVLAALAYTETRFRHRRVEPSSAEHDGHFETERAGLFALSAAELDRAAAGATDIRAHAFAAAELLASHVEGPWPQTTAQWHPVLTSWRGVEVADAVMRHLSRGLRGLDIDGESIIVTARSGLEAFGPTAAFAPFAARQGFPDAIWNPAHSSNYSGDSRGPADINYIVVHTIQGSYGSAINWFKNSSANVSAHYVVKSSDGEVTQMVDDSDRAWHDACFNNETIGIEHEGYIDEPELWYSESMYMASARLAAHLARTYNIPIDRDHFFGHGDAPDCSTHTDPGPGWDWDHFMALVRADGEPDFDASFVDVEWPSQMVAGEEAVVWFEFENLSNITWGLDETRLGTAGPQDRISPFFAPGNWLSENRATGADHSNYTPGETGRFSFIIRAPEVDEPTTFTETYQLVQEGVAWFGPTASAQVTVVPRGWTPGDDGNGGVLDDDDVAANGAGGCSSAGQTSGRGLGGYVILLSCVVLALRRRRRAGVRAR